MCGPSGRLPPGPSGRFPSGPSGHLPSGPSGRLPTGPSGRFPSGPSGRFPSGPSGEDGPRTRRRRRASLARAVTRTRNTDSARIAGLGPCTRRHSTVAQSGYPLPAPSLARGTACSGRCNQYMTITGGQVIAFGGALPPGWPVGRQPARPASSAARRAREPMARSPSPPDY